MLAGDIKALRVVGALLGCDRGRCIQRPLALFLCSAQTSGEHEVLQIIGFGIAVPRR